MKKYSQILYVRYCGVILCSILEMQQEDSSLLDELFLSFLVTVLFQHHCSLFIFLVSLFCCFFPPYYSYKNVQNSEPCNKSHFNVLTGLMMSYCIYST